MSRRGQDRLGESLPAPLRGLAGLLALVAVAAGVAYAVLSLSGLLADDDRSSEEIFAGAVEGGAAEDPFAWEPDRRKDLERGAALGFSHVIYELSPGGVIASARRTARFRDAIERAAEEHGVSAEMMEAMVLLESAGRPEVIAGGTDPANASGLAQIVASTGIDLLGMKIDLARSQELTSRILASTAAAERLRKRGRRLAGKQGKQPVKKARKLFAEADAAERDAGTAGRERVRADARFFPADALDGMARYLEIATEDFGREDLAVTSYHMGIGNLGDVVRSYVSPEEAQMPLRDLVALRDLSYSQIFFDSSPAVHAKTWGILSGFNDDSSSYYWRVLAALEIMRLFREDRGELKRLASLHGNKATAEEVFHPQEDTRAFDDAGELADGLDSGELVSIPSGGGYGFVVGPQLGELADQLGVDRSLYRSLRPEALATLIYISGRVQAIAETLGTKGKKARKEKLTVTSAARDRAYQDALVGRNTQATQAYSLHTTGYSFDILRDYVNDRQAEAFQSVLDRMEALGVIDYAREPEAIHVTVSDRAEQLLG
ncbi:MAG: DUF5715 family protein [Solirubrobacterales bacterium]